jgi:hypothetical protein
MTENPPPTLTAQGQAPQAEGGRKKPEQAFTCSGTSMLLGKSLKRRL